jgi:hypothetical protein
MKIDAANDKINKKKQFAFHVQHQLSRHVATANEALKAEMQYLSIEAHCAISNFKHKTTKTLF